MAARHVAATKIAAMMLAAIIMAATKMAVIHVAATKVAVIHVAATKVAAMRCHRCDSPWQSWLHPDTVHTRTVNYII